MKSQWFKYLFLFFFLLNNHNFYGQEKAPANKKAEASKREIRKKERKAAREHRRKEREERLAVKNYHKRLQTKKVRKRMKRSKHKATLHNENKREPWIKRIFMKKKKV